MEIFLYSHILLSPNTEYCPMPNKIVHMNSMSATTISNSQFPTRIYIRIHLSDSQFIAFLRQVQSCSNCTGSDLFPKPPVTLAVFILGNKA